MNSEIGTREMSRMDLHVQIIRSAELKLLALWQQRAELMKRIGSIKRTLIGLANAFGDAVLNQRLLSLLDRSTVRRSGFTQDCRAVRESEETIMSLSQVKLIYEVFTPVQKKETTAKRDAMDLIDRESMRPVTWISMEEICNGEWSIGGKAMAAEADRTLAANR